MNVFNLTPFNLGFDAGQPVIRYAKIRCEISIIGIVGVGKTVRGIVRCDVSIMGEARLFIRKLAAVSCDINIMNRPLTLRKNVFGRIAGNVNILSQAKMGKNIYPQIPYDINILSSVRLGKNIYAKAPYDVNILSSVKLGKMVYAKMNAVINILGLLQISAYLYDTAFINVTIPPGGELRIDSDNYTVLLNGDDIFRLYRDSGGNESDWINLFRKTVSLTVEAGSGGALNGQIQYTEMYL